MIYISLYNSLLCKGRDIEIIHIVKLKINHVAGREIFCIAINNIISAFKISVCLIIYVDYASCVVSSCYVGDVANMVNGWMVYIRKISTKARISNLLNFTYINKTCEHICGIQLRIDHTVVLAQRPVQNKMKPTFLETLLSISNA